MRPYFLLSLAFILVPLLEIALFIEVGARLGALPILGLVVLTAVAGATLLRLQGLVTLARVQQKLDRGELPAQDLAAGLILLIGAVLLLTPGFLTDLAGLLSLVPALRRPAASRLLRLLFEQRARRPGGTGMDEDIIEGEVVAEQDSVRAPGPRFQRKPGNDL